MSFAGNGSGAVIEYRNVFKAFDLPVLSGVTLSVEEGEMFALFGPSGTGKSVLLKTTIGLITPDRGDVAVGGESVYFGGRDVLERIRRKVGYVFQYAALFDSLTVYENVEIGIPKESLKQMTSREIAHRAWESLELVNLEPKQVLAMLPSELSGGMKKRVGIARAISGTPGNLAVGRADNRARSGEHGCHRTTHHTAVRRLARDVSVGHTRYRRGPRDV